VGSTPARTRAELQRLAEPSLAGETLLGDGTSQDQDTDAEPVATLRNGLSGAPTSANGSTQVRAYDFSQTEQRKSGPCGQFEADGSLPITCLA
jgi:hypothetical protein